MVRIVLIGEAMLELSRKGHDWQLGYGGDTLNTAIHLARAGHDVAYFTALGCDPLTIGLKAKWAQEGLDTTLVLDHPNRNTGLYAISTDAQGERSFTYWRDNSAAREMFVLPGAAQAVGAVAEADCLAFSLISLAILPDQSRLALLELATQVRENGGNIAFDGNYRPRLWRDAREAIRWRDAAIACATIGLPTLDDEISLCGEIDAHAVSTHWQSLGCGELIVKLGARGCRLHNGMVIEPETIVEPLDTSGAGDAFNAGYLSARLKGADQAEAARAGHELAAWTIMRSGAIPPKEAWRSRG